MQETYVKQCGICNFCNTTYVIAALAHKIKKSQPYLTQIENGTRKGTLATMAKLAAALGTTIDCIMD